MLVNTTTVSDQVLPSVAALSSGGYVVTWLDYSGLGGDTDGAGLKAQLFNASGAKVGSEFLVNTTTVSDQFDPAVTALSSGGFVATWVD
jgi:hypothetical protein